MPRQKFLGNVISATKVTQTPSSSEGVWTLSEIAQAEEAGTWPFEAQFVEAKGPDDHAGHISGDYRYHVFIVTKSGSDGFVVEAQGNSAGSTTLEVLIVAGGGSGGQQQAGGGGAGGYRVDASLACPAIGNYTVTIGLGGVSVSSNGPGNVGNPSTFHTITSAGGGKGGSYSGAAGDGASGGGGGGEANRTGGSAVPSGQGNAGGEGKLAAQYRGGGGGGSAAVGATGVASGDGGAGTENLIAGTGYGETGYYAGGGGSQVHPSGPPGEPPGTGGSGGGGDGATGAATAGTANTGGGGGGGSPSGAGGSGIVIIKYKFQ